MNMSGKMNEMNKDDCNHRIRSKFKYFFIKIKREDNENGKNETHCVVSIKIEIKEKQVKKNVMLSPSEIKWSAKGRDIM